MPWGAPFGEGGGAARQDLESVLQQGGDAEGIPITSSGAGRNPLTLVNTLLDFESRIGASQQPGTTATNVRTRFVERASRTTFATTNTLLAASGIGLGDVFPNSTIEACARVFITLADGTRYSCTVVGSGRVIDNVFTNPSVSKIIGADPPAGFSNAGIELRAQSGGENYGVTVWRNGVNCQIGVHATYTIFERQLP
jgi:hypothetical protein